MKKTLLALAITALSANAFAVDLNAGTGVQVFAKEIVVPATGKVLGLADDAATPITESLVTATVKAGFALATDGYVRFELSNGATFAGTPALASAPTTSLYSISAGGEGQDFVIFRTNGNGILVGDALTLSTQVKVVNKEAVSVSYSLYETASNAVNEVGALNSKSGSLLKFASAVSVSAANAVDANIDAIGGESKTFISNSSASLADAKIAALTDLTTGVDTDVLLATGAPISDIADIASDYAWTLSGNFSAAAEVADSTPTAFVLADDKQSAKLQDAANGIVTYEVTGLDEIAETNVTATFSATPVSGYTIADVAISNAAVLTKNGVTRDVDLALKPGGAYSNYVRISNKDTIAGGFSIRVINDAGDAVSFPLNAVAGQPATLDAGASTAQMTIQSIFDAAVAKGLALSGEGKLRLQVTGQVNDLDVQTYTVSKDGNSFATF